MVWSRLSETFYFFRQHLLALLWLLLPVLVPVSLFLNHRFYVVQGADPDKAMADSVALGLQLVAGLYANTIVIRYTLACLDDHSVPGYGKLWQEALGRLPTLFFVQILVGLLVVAGLFLFIVPGVWLAGVLMPAFVLAVAEPASAGETLKTAWSRFRPGAWQISGSMGVLFLGLLVVMSGFEGARQLLGAQDLTVRWLAGAVLDVAGMMCAQSAMILLVRFYDLERSSRQESKS